MPPTRSIGRIATAMTMKPIPPSQWRMARHRRMPGGRDIQADDHGRTGRGDARHRFEHRVGRGQVELAERERQRGERADHDPHRAGQEKGLAAGQLGIAVALVHQDQGDPGEQGDRAAARNTCQSGCPAAMSATMGGTMNRARMISRIPITTRIGRRSSATRRVTDSGAAAATSGASSADGCGYPERRARRPGWRPRTARPSWSPSDSCRP